MANWAELPKDLLRLILDRLPFTSMFSFKAVCCPWFSFAQEEAKLFPSSRPRSSPWLTLPPPKLDDEDKKDCSSLFSLENKKVYYIKKKRPQTPEEEPPVEAQCVGSSHDWLAFINRNCIMNLSNPFTPFSPIIHLPSIETLPSILGVKRKSSSIAKYYKYWNAHVDSSRLISPTLLSKIFVTKIILSSAPPSSQYTVMAIQGEIYELAFCKSGDTAWTALDGPLRPYTDILYSNNDQQFYALSDHGFVEAWDLRDSSSPKRTYIDTPLVPRIPSFMNNYEQWLRSWCSEKIYLMESLGDLLLVIRYIARQVDDDRELIMDDDDDDAAAVDDADDGDNDDDNDDDGNDKDVIDDDFVAYDCPFPLPYKTIRFDVYKLNRLQPKWVHVKCLGDCVLFLGFNHSVSLSARDFPELRGNSIYFTDDNGKRMRWEGHISYGGHDLGVFNLEDNSIEPCYPGDYDKILPSPVWVVPNP